MSNLGTGIRTIWGPNGPELDPYWRRVSGGLAVVHSVARRLVTPRGRLSWAPGVGFDVGELLNEGLTEAAVRTIATYCRAEVLADERVEAAEVEFVLDHATHKARLTVRISTSTKETFRLVVAVSKLTTEILAIEKAA